MKVALYSGNIPSTTFIENLIKGLSDSGIEILLFGKKNGKVNYGSNVKIYPTPVSVLPLIVFVMIESLKLLFSNPGLYFRAIKILSLKKKGIGVFIKNAGMILPILNQRPDIFHIQWAKTISQNPELFELLKSRIVLSLRGAHINYSPLFEKQLAESYRKYFPYIDSFHAVSKAIGDEALIYGAEKRKIKVIYSSVNKELLEMDFKSGIQNKKIEIISIGRFHWKKGYHYALDAMNLLKLKKIDFKYTIVAQGKIPEEIIFLINEYDLGENVKIIPGLDFKELVLKLKESDLLILPSVEEGIANVVLEAMAVGVAVITTDCGGMNEAVENNINGYIVKVREPVLIAEKIIGFLNSDKKFKDELIKNSKATIRDKFSSVRQVNEFRDLYNSISLN